VNRFLSPRLRRRRNEGGYVLMTAALVLIPLLVVTGMAVDFGGGYWQGVQMQRATDAASLAGVIWLPDLAKATTATIRRKLITLPARVASSAWRVTLHLPQHWPHEPLPARTSADLPYGHWLRPTARRARRTPHRAGPAKARPPMPTPQPRHRGSRLSAHQRHRGRNGPDARTPRALEHHLPKSPPPAPCRLAPTARGRDGTVIHG